MHLVSVSGVTYVTWTGVIKTVRLWVAPGQDGSFLGSTLSRCCVFWQVVPCG